MLRTEDALRAMVATLLIVFNHSASTSARGKALYVAQNIDRLQKLVETNGIVIPASHMVLLAGAVNTATSLARLEPTTQNSACLDVMLQYALRQITICDLAGRVQACSSSVEREGGKLVCPVSSGGLGMPDMSKEVRYAQKSQKTLTCTQR